jgi:hypothetical protein
MLIGYTGAQGTGKSTSTFELAATMKKTNANSRVAVITEIASHSPFPINEKTTKESQLWIFTAQLQKELELCKHYGIVISDRTRYDAIAYTLAAGFHDLVADMIRIAAHGQQYEKIIFKTISNNDFLLEDGVRSLNREFRDKIEGSLIEVYNRAKIIDKVVWE